MQKVAGVESVRVSLNDGLTVLDFAPGNKVTVAQLRTILKNSGFVSKEARLDAVGAIAESASRLVFSISGTGEEFAVTPTGAAYENVKQRLTTSGPIQRAEIKCVALDVGKPPHALMIESIK